MNTSVPVFVGLDYSRCGMQTCALDSAGRVLLNRTLPDNAVAIAAAVGRPARSAVALWRACTGAADLAEELADGSARQCTWRIPAS